MSGKSTIVRYFLIVLLLGTILSAAETHAQSDVVEFGPERWEMANAETVNRFGRECVTGAAILKDVVFENGVVEVDIATPGRTRAYPGIVFRMQDQTNMEWVYIRPHRSPFYTDAIQYTPMINQVTGWQLYSGEGYTAGADFPADVWVHLKLEISGSQARVYVNGAEEPDLAISDLKHGTSRGAIGVLDSTGEAACFSNFSYSLDDDLQFEAPPATVASPGTITNWEISRAIKAERVNRDAYPGFLAIANADWQTVESEPSGLVDIGRYAVRTEGGPDLVFARTVVRAPETQDIEFSFGYSDAVDLFLNGKKVFSANSAYRSRDPSFLGVIGPFDAVNLTLEKGLNEIFLMVTENFGGWGLMGATDPELELPNEEHDRVTKVWETADTFLTPESILYDPDRRVLYVTNYDINTFSTPDLTGYISKLSLDGEVLEERWVTGLKGPAGMNIHENTLYVAERTALTEIDMATGEILQRHTIPGSQFLNDVSIDSNGDVYVTDTYPSSHILSRIYRLKDGEVEEWYGGREIDRANGLHLHGNELLIGNSGDGLLKAVDLEHKTLRRIACFGAGVIDGIRLDNDGNYIVSKWDGQVYTVSPDGDVVEILDIMPEGLNAADFEYLPEQNLLVIPTFLGNKVVAYRINYSGE
jgi:sugar lactone lactonase YvrE